MVSPHTECLAGDLVFVRLKDKKAGLKLFARENAKSFFLKAYMDAGDGSAPFETHEEISKKDVKEIAPVIFVRRRP
jgi:hypothetical protein